MAQSRLFHGVDELAPERVGDGRDYQADHVGVPTLELACHPVWHVLERLRRLVDRSAVA